MKVVVGGQSVYLLEDLNLQVPETQLVLINSLMLLPHPNPWCGHCESFANQCCHPSEGAGEKNDGEGGGKKTVFSHIVKEQNENAERNAHTHTQRRK